MISIARYCLLLGACLMLVSSCALMPSAIRSEGEMRLVRVQAPEAMQEELPYNVTVFFEADGQPQIKKVCFQWLTLTAPIHSASLYCYSHEVETNQQIDASCSKWVGEGLYTRVSPISCTNAINVEYGTPGRFIASLAPENVKSYYNALECRVEYVQGGELKETKKISARVLVQQ